MKNSTFLLLICFLATSTACIRLDSNLFNPDTDITEYLFDDYADNEWNFLLPASYDIPDSLISLFSLEATPRPLDGEAQGDPRSIYAAYVGDIGRITTDTVIVYCHGNGGHMDDYWQRVKLLANTGGKNRFGVLAMDYSGFGLSEGTPSEAAMYGDVDACLAWLAANGATGDRVVLYGFSLGSAPATELTANPEILTPGWLILEAPFASAEVMVQDAAGLAMPASFYTDLEIDNAEEIKSIDQPFLWLHGIADDFLSLEHHGLVVWENYGGTRGVDVRVVHADHSDIPPVMGVEAYADSVLAFLVGR